MYATNHFIHDAFAADGKNDEREREGTTLARARRLEELLKAAGRELDPAAAVAILRDRRALGGAEVGIGHRGTIDALIATHAVVFDLTARKLWVSSAPHTLGELVAYDLDEATRGIIHDHGALPADPLLANGGYARFEEAQRLLEEAKALGKGDPKAAAARARKALALAPGHPPALLRLAELCASAGDVHCAREAYRAFLDGRPPHLAAAKQARARLAELSR
jgi:hypothetical protein